MRHFKIYIYKVLLLLSLGLTPVYAWSQEAETPSVVMPTEEDEVLQESNQNNNTNFIPLIFDAVLIDYVELAETDDDGELRFSTIELSVLPSTPNPAPFVNLDSTIDSLDLLDSSITQLQESIFQYELEGGVYDYRLSELYLSVGNTYQQLDKPQLAIDAFNEALQLSRINGGLFTEDQLPVVEKLVESYLNLGDIPTANLNQEYLFYIQQKINGAAHPIILIELLEYADWNLHAASLSLGYFPDIQSLHFRTNFLDENNLYQSEKIENLLTAAVFAYSQAIVIQHDLEAKFNEEPNDVKTIELQNRLNYSEDDLDIATAEQKLAYAFFLQYQFDLNNIAVSAYDEAPSTYFLNSAVNGRRALERRYAYLQNSNRPDLDEIEALVDIADWYLYFERWTTAEEIYVQVFNLMESNGIGNIAGLAYPELPTYIPSFLSSPYTRGSNRLTPEEGLDYEGYIDINFSLSRYARPNRIRIQYISDGTTVETQRALISKLRSSTYRRQLENQTEYTEGTYSVRYYYTAQLPDDE